MSEPSEKPTFRINTKVSHKINDWLDQRMTETGMSKSMIINLAIEEHRAKFLEREDQRRIAHLIDQMEALEKKIDELTAKE